MNELTLAGAQRALDQLPRPPYELPPGDPMRMLDESLASARAAQDETDDVERQYEDVLDAAEDTQEEVAALKDEVEDLKDDLEELREERASIEEELAARGIDINDLMKAA
jgi:predicted  nucleic acid-binding Zn-ribbon protein